MPRIFGLRGFSRIDPCRSRKSAVDKTPRLLRNPISVELSGAVNRIHTWNPCGLYGCPCLRLAQCPSICSLPLSEAVAHPHAIINQWAESRCRPGQSDLRKGIGFSGTYERVGSPWTIPDRVHEARLAA